MIYLEKDKNVCSPQPGQGLYYLEIVSSNPKNATVISAWVSKSAKLAVLSTWEECHTISHHPLHWS